jgi:hypothetical protein
MINDLILSQMTDPFRIGLLIALLLTAYRTRAVTGLMIPLAAGAVFVAVLIPTTMQPDSPDLVLAIAAGVVGNAAVLAVLVVLRGLILRLMGRVD